MILKSLFFVAAAAIVITLVPNAYAGEANPYCDLLSDEERRDVTCHDRKDYSDTTGLYTCNDGSHKENWEDCPDVSGYDYDNNNNDNELANEQCWDDGYDDGQNNPFDQDRYGHFNAEGTDNPYYHALGCKDAGNTEETCETFTDQ